MIELKNIKKSYKNKKGQKTEVLKDICLKFDSIGLTSILGKSGSGKSTLLNIIGGLDDYDSGELILFGKNSSKFNNKDFNNYRNDCVGFVFQDFNIIEDYTVYENIILSTKLQNQKVDNKELDSLLEKLEILEFKNRKSNELSGGQKQRVAIARALIKKPKVILADEPTGNLDSKTGQDVMNLLKEISNNTLVILVTHNEEYSKKYSDRIIRIEDGKIIDDEVISRKEKISSYYNKRLKKTHLPIKEALRLGYLSLKCKKLKLLFTILLISFSTLFLSLSFLIKNYSVVDNQIKMLNDDNNKYAEIKKVIYKDNNTKIYSNINKNDYEYLKSNINSEYNIVYSLNEPFNLIKLLNINIYQQEDLFNDLPEEEKDLYEVYPSSVKIIELNSNKDLMNKKIIGSYPNNNNEIVISNYVADLIIKNGIYKYNSDDIFYPKDYSDLISSKIKINFGSYNNAIIVGIIDYDLSEFQKLKGLYQKNNPEIKKSDLNLSTKLRLYSNNLYNMIYVNDKFIKNLKYSDFEKTLIPSNSYIALYDSNKKISKDRINSIQKEVEYYDGKEWKKTKELADNQMIISILDVIGDDQYSNYVEELEKYVNKYPYKDKMELEKEFISKTIDLSNIINKTVLLKVYENVDYVLDLRKPADFESKNIKIIGIAGLLYSNNTSNLFSDNLLSKYKNEYINITGLLLQDYNSESLKKYFSLSNSDSKYTIYTVYSNDIDSYAASIKSFENYINIAMIIFLIFSSILIFNFMFSSIESKKKDIGILKALGANRIDIIKIFIFEIIILSILSTLLSSLLLFIIFNVLNNTIMYTSNLLISPFYLNFKLMLIIYIYILLEVFVSSIIPINKISKMKPIDAIMNR